MNKQNRKNMDTTLRKPARRRKVIDLSPKAYQSLTDMAADHGTDLKHFIESSLEEMAENYDDAETYTYLLQSHPEGTDMVCEEDGLKFEQWLGL